MRAQASPPHPPSVYAAAACAPQGRRPRLRVRSRNYKIISRCPEEIPIRLRSVPAHDGAPVSRLKMSTCLSRPLREAPRIRAQEISSRGKTHSVMAWRRPARDSLGAPTIFQTGGAGEGEKKKKTGHKSRRQGPALARCEFFFCFFLSRRRPLKLKCCNYQGWVTLK